jgi:hypothetical protein
MLPHVAAELVGQDERWRSMVDRIGTVATQSVQLWFEDRVGAPDAVVTGFGPPLDTVASMTHTIAHEAWPAPGPQSAVSLCSVLGEGGGDDTVRSHCAQFLAGPARRMWPGLGVAPRASYVRANTDPSDRYVQSLPGSGAFRMRADDSGYAGLFLAGDWLDTGLNAGCIEAATLGGLQAANAVEGRPVTDGTVGFGPHQPRHTVAAGGQ